MNKSLKIICSALCVALTLPLLTACDKEGKEETTSSASAVSPAAPEVSTAPIDTNDVPAIESPLAKEEFIFGNVFFNKAVTTVELSDTTIDSFEPLIDCPYLQTITLSGCEIKDFSGLNSLTQISHLTISDCGFENLSYISDLIQLQSLDISNNKITDIIKLSSLKNLNSLMVTGGDLQSIGAVKYMSGLQVLRLDAKNCSDLSPLEGLKSLKSCTFTAKRLPIFPILRIRKIFVILSLKCLSLRIFPFWRI